ncbi:hypothetical protein AAIR98_000049 [Elusimicrobium simillimum]
MSLLQKAAKVIPTTAVDDVADGFIMFNLLK